MSSSRERPSRARMLAAIRPRRVFLRITKTLSSPSSRLSRWPARAEFKPVIVVADEQQRRVDARLVVVHGEGQALVLETGEGSRRRNEHRQPLASAEPLLLRIAVADHQRIEADRAVVDEDAAVHLGNVDAALLAGGDQFRRFVEIGRDAEVAREMVERAEGKDTKRGVRADECRGRGADRPVATADDDQLVATFGDRLGANLAIAAVDELDVRVDAGGFQRRGNLVGNGRIARRWSRRRG